MQTLNEGGASVKRIIDHFLVSWKTEYNRKPLLLRGARQVGKTHAVRTLGKTFAHFVEINLEEHELARKIFDTGVDAKRILKQLAELIGEPIQPGKTLLFLDEIQAVPKTITALRYLYEHFPDLHVIAAGSLLEFAIAQVGLPVGRISFLYMYPLSFLEFLAAAGHPSWVSTILHYNATDEEQISTALHEQLLILVGTYLAIGGMPAAINAWVASSLSREASKAHESLLAAYQQDFDKYARAHQIKYLQLIFKHGLEQLSKKFIFSHVGEYQKRELEPALELLIRAGLFHRVTRSASQGIPLGSQADLSDFKLIFFDVGLTQALLKLKITEWFLDPLAAMVNKGMLVEAFVGQELLVYADPITREELYYWQRASKNSDAEIDYVVQYNEQVVPIEVKAGTSLRIKSMHLFLASHQERSSYGVRFSARLHGCNDQIYSYPLYAIAKPFIVDGSDMHQALLTLAVPV